MAASSIQITQGSGTRLATDSYTEGAVIVHNERVGIGDAINATYGIVAAMSTATANSHLLQIMAGASLRVRVLRIEYYLDTPATTVALGVVSLVRLTTAGTGGVAIGVNAFDPAEAAAGATAMQLPTTKGTEGTTLWNGTMKFLQTLSASDDLLQPRMVWDFDRLRAKPVIIAAGTANGIVIRQDSAIAGANARISVLIAESSY